MAGVPSLFGGGATLGLGGGPIRSQDQNSVSFGTRTVNFGSDDTTKITNTVIIIVLIGALLWLMLPSNRS